MRDSTVTGRMWQRQKSVGERGERRKDMVICSRIFGHRMKNSMTLIGISDGGAIRKDTVIWIL